MEYLKRSRMSKTLDLFLLCLISTVHSQTELVQQFQCSIHSSNLTLCSWIPSSLAVELRFLYQIENADGSVSKDDPVSLPSQECSAYVDTGGIRTGCHLQNLKATQVIKVQLSGKINNMLVSKNFEQVLSKNVKPDHLNWMVIKDEKQFSISWIPPDIFPLHCWDFTIKYNKCGNAKIHAHEVKSMTSTKLTRDSHCQYNMTLKADAEPCGSGEVWSEAKYFDADADVDALLYAAIIIPLVIAILAALACVCFRKHKEKILPPVPRPRDFLSDISNNSSKIKAGKLYTPAKEEECKISLVIEPN